MSVTRTILTFSHLRWDFVYQRPQHLMSRLAGWARVLFVEEPEHTPDREPFWTISRPTPELVVCRPHTPLDAPGFQGDQPEALIPLLRQLLAEHQVGDLVAWLYTPLPLPAAQALSPRVLVYDCMDELSAFLHAPAGLLERERDLLASADLVFTGGPSLYRAKRDRNPRVHCFPSSVDAAHFRQALGGADEPADQAGLPHPRLGFYGVIDERLDPHLPAALADAHPDWQIVMVGPIVKIDPATLPRRPNIHYLGQRSYDELPGLLAGWDVCLLPFARNDATRFISPTKTLEYMAAERPIVSTPITDVAEPYGEIVYLGDTPEQFVTACERALASGPAERAERVARMRSVLAHTSWDSTVQAMRDLILSRLEA
ncbi:MAG TPA: glycosyltransferase [Roseiflexaceae bacterium]|nr:glycosyltransferase [Roseiflexaceae bacterium]